MAKKKAAKQAKTTNKKMPAPASPEKEKAFDFGGVPDRNLKKNLGCG
jgi:hypothetical protein